MLCIEQLVLLLLHSISHWIAMSPLTQSVTAVRL